MKRLYKDTRGQDLVEYALLLVFLGLAVITILPELGATITNMFSKANSALVTASSR